MTRLSIFIVLFLIKQPSFANRNIEYLEADCNEQISQINDRDTSISLEYFNAVPDTIQLWGCLGEFTYDSINTKKDKYIIFISSEGFAMILVNNKLIYLDKISETKPSNKKLEQKYRGQNFDMTLNLKKKSEEYLVTHYSGILVLNYNNQSHIFKIIGKFAC